MVTSVSLCGMRVSPELCEITGLDANGFSWLSSDSSSSLRLASRRRAYLCMSSHPDPISRWYVPRTREIIAERSGSADSRGSRCSSLERSPHPAVLDEGEQQPVDVGTHRAAVAQHVVLEALDDVARAAGAQQREEEHPERQPRAAVALQRGRRGALREDGAVGLAEREEVRCGERCALGEKGENRGNLRWIARESPRDACSLRTARRDTAVRCARAPSAGRTRCE